MTIRVAVVDDQPLLVSAFTALVNAQSDMTVVATAANGQEAIYATINNEIDVMLMDIRMPVLDGVDATQAISKAGALPRILVLTTFNIDDLVLGAVSAGARGYLLKEADPRTVLEGVRAVHRGEAVMDPAIVEHLVHALHTTPNSPSPTLTNVLTGRELEVLRLIARGLTNLEIADALFVAMTTVKTHVSSLLLKLDARDRVALVILAHSVGLVSSPGPLTL